jgi:hypothetical protein
MLSLYAKQFGLMDELYCCGSLQSALLALFAWLISHQPAVLFSHNKQATNNQPAVLSFQNKPASATSQPNRLPIPI